MSPLLITASHHRRDRPPNRHWLYQPRGGKQQAGESAPEGRTQRPGPALRADFREPSRPVRQPVAEAVDEPDRAQPQRAATGAGEESRCRAQGSYRRVARAGRQGRVDPGAQSAPGDPDRGQGQGSPLPLRSPACPAHPFHPGRPPAAQRGADLGQGDSPPPGAPAYRVLRQSRPAGPRSRTNRARRAWPSNAAPSTCASSPSWRATRRSCSRWKRSWPAPTRWC